MNIYKLKFATHDEAESTFISLGVKQIINNKGLDEYVYANGTQAVVKLPPQIKSDEVYYPEVFYDVMTSDVIDFGVNEIFPVTATHSFYINV